MGLSVTGEETAGPVWGRLSGWRLPDSLLSDLMGDAAKPTFGGSAD